ncbi:MAG TPA: hypothetical protein VHN77_08530 [Phycisphaerales bacterium]|nr:hypothetical protein [Phycisphaerales bacterium]
MANIMLTGLSKIGKQLRKYTDGEVFVMHIPRVGWIPMLVVNTNARIDEFNSGTLVYIFNSIVRGTSDDVPVIDITTLDKNNLVIPPCIVGRDLWRGGLVVKVGVVRDLSVMTRPHHCFRCVQFSPVRYFDESGKETMAETGPCADSGLYLPAGIEREIRSALAK